MITLILLFICALYSIGSLLTLSLEDFWCKPRYTWNEIAAFNRAQNSSTGVGGCYATTNLVAQVDTSITQKIFRILTCLLFPI